MWQGNPRGRHRQVSHLPADLIESFIQNEYATLKWLSKTGIPVIEAYGYGLASDPSNRVGVSYIFLGVMPGKPRNTSHRSQGCVRAQQVDVPSRTHRASEDPVRIAQDLGMYMTPNPFVERGQSSVPRGSSSAAKVEGQGTKSASVEFVSANSAATWGVRGFGPVANVFLFDTAKIEGVILVCNGGRRLSMWLCLLDGGTTSSRLILPTQRTTEVITLVAGSELVVLRELIDA
ncbi:unnamed protein product [Clonostachys chloroleuca]|uniref:Uncharacterized protein n=1 Tax=Clonostachys chloroleuca TaxID=1926264 RepID=A0AA35Q075_9HYPO|nr:unnamed protein product [Clonostachys chloroleuca]